jgi:iron-sulfur cluster repair protein YtfE (RIC family)
MSNIVQKTQSESLGPLIKKLVEEHCDFFRQEQVLETKISNFEFQTLSKMLALLKESLVAHMLVEESEVFSEVSRCGVFNERVSEIMQQHVEITAALQDMRFSLRAKNLEELKRTFEKLIYLMQLHFPAEEAEVFSLVS